MSKNKNKLLFLSGLLPLTMVPLMAISCGDKNKPNNPTPDPKKPEEPKKPDLETQKKVAKEILDLKAEKEKKLKEAGLDGLQAPTKEQSEKIVEILNEFIAKADKVDQSGLTPDSLAWLKGIKYNWEIEKGNHEKGLRYLLGTFSSGPGRTYVANSFYRRTLTTRNVSVAKNWLQTLKEAIDLKLVPSKIFIKNNINAILGSLFSKELLEFVNSGENEKTVESIIESNTTLPKEVKDFYKFYVTEYYKASEYGKGEDIQELKVYKNNDTIKEQENSITILGKDNKPVQVYGLGLTKKDLEQENAGLGYMPGKPGGLTGKDVYEQVLKMNTTSNLTPKQVFDKGYDSTTSSAKNMENVAKEVAKLITGSETSEWKAKFKYDEDGVGSKEAAETELTIRKADGTIDLAAFNKWLNAEDFFFGREEKSYYTDEIKKSLREDSNLEFARKELTKFNYDFLKSDLEKDKKYGSITNEQFYYGALEAFKGYAQFKATTQKYGAGFFGKNVPDYDIQTYDYESREYEGVGAYSSSVKKFMFNADPYYGLPKWSVTSFANHESMMGHHNQIMYANNHLAKIGDYQLPNNTFSYTSYVEGWALFMEWFGIESGFYGTPDYTNSDYYAMPKDFSLSKGITSFFTTTDKTKITDEQVKQIKELHGGVYWNKVNSLSKYSDDKDRALAAVKLANMLQYYGALNEAQLRNMRLAVDTAYHGGITTGKGLEGGASIMKAREWMKANSALGIGDITSESKRYFNLVGQATSYNSGKEVMLDLYKKVQNKLRMTREQFINAKNDEFKEHGEIKKFFDWLLRNGALPMQALIETITKVYDLK
ncbi:DUF885 family protein [Metamycoplasma buccale]|uniref:DUF885 family protein n=1 Tax=Metamycoplasma buccale TaxID=55602 RepID=UPI00398F2972